jgi:hypothetical protein
MQSPGSASAEEKPNGVHVVSLGRQAYTPPHSKTLTISTKMAINQSSKNET